MPAGAPHAARPAAGRAPGLAPAPGYAPPPVAPAAAPYGGSTVLAERRARKRSSLLKTILLLLFAFAAIFLTIVLVGGLSLYSHFSEGWQREQERHDTALNTATAKLAQHGVELLGDEAEITFYDDGCIVKGRGVSNGALVPCEVSINIRETAERVIWVVEQVKVNHELVYTGMLPLLPSE
jgi:hypothetical protein